MAELFAGAKLLKNGGGEATGAVLEGKVVGIYFSAHWCPPCRGFTPVLKDFHAELEDGGEFEVVYVSLDRSEEDLQNYLKESHGPWYYLALNDPLVKELPTKFGVSGIPMLVIVKPNGEVVTKNGRADVQGKPPAQALAAWKSA